MDGFSFATFMRGKVTKRVAYTICTHVMQINVFILSSFINYLRGWYAWSMCVRAILPLYLKSFSPLHKYMVSIKPPFLRYLYAQHVVR